MLVLIGLIAATVTSAAVSTDSYGNEAMMNEAGSETVVCKSQVVIGSIIPMKVCKPLAEWIEENRADDPFEVELVENYGVRTLNSWED